MFIGTKEIKVILDNEDGKSVDIEFVEAENPSVKLNKELFDLIKSEEKSTGNITDQVNHYFAKKFVAELAYYGLEFYSASNIGTAMGVLAHNLREDLFRKTFDCDGADSVSLRLLLDK